MRLKQHATFRGSHASVEPALVGGVKTKAGDGAKCLFLLAVREESPTYREAGEDFVALLRLL